MDRKATTSRKIDDAVARSVNFELSIADIARRSERRAWWVASSAIGVTLILAGGYFYMLPLKQKVPYLVMADAYTGTSTIARLTDDAAHRRISASEAINRSNVAHYVMARESYDLAMLNLADWTTVQTMSAPGVKATYTRMYASANPENLVKTYGKDTAIRIKLLSIVLIGGGPGVTPKGATVRFQRSLYNKQTGLTRPLDNKIATLELSYKTNLQMDDQSRIVNPLGFWITDYRVDNDYATTPPLEMQGAPAPSMRGQVAAPSAADMQSPANSESSAAPASDDPIVSSKPAVSARRPATTSVHPSSSTGRR
ncbi:MAG: VirB8/TrbF family protein [Rhodanobacter sp.]